MSLKAFHVLFIAVSVIFAIAFGVWAFREYRVRSDVALLWLGVASWVGAAGLLIYGRWFLKKLRGVDCL